LLNFELLKNLQIPLPLAGDVTRSYCKTEQI